MPADSVQPPVRGYCLEPVLDSLVAALAHMIENRQTYGGTQGSRHVHQHFSWRNLTAQLLQTMELLSMEPGGHNRIQ